MKPSSPHTFYKQRRKVKGNKLLQGAVGKSIPLSPSCQKSNSNLKFKSQLNKPVSKENLNIAS